MLNNFIRGVATQIASSALRNVSNNLLGNNLSYNTGNGSGGANTHDFRSLEPTGNSKNYVFPLDVESGPGLGNQGHYMMFFINQQTKAKLSFGKTGGFSSVGQSGQRNRDIPRYIKVLNANGNYSTQANYSGFQDSFNLDDANTAAEMSGISPGQIQAMGTTGLTTWYNQNRRAVAVERAPTKRMNTAIAMYMPASVNTSYGANYTDTDIGSQTNAAIQAYEKLVAGNMRGTVNQISGMVDTFADDLTVTALSIVGAIPAFAGTKEASEMKSGVIMSDRMELAFKGIDKRKFEYTFKMIPKSQREAEEIRNIIFAFKSSMMPEFEGGNLSGRKLIVPNTFDIEYMWNGAENQFINKISECVLTNMNVSYGGDSYKTHEGIDGDGAPPIETTISLSFSELELITREKIHEGF